MFNKVEMVGAAISAGMLLLAVYLVQVEATFLQNTSNQPAQVQQATDPDIVVVEDTTDLNQARANAYVEAADQQGTINRMVVDDIRIGTGSEVAVGDTVVVHYVGTLQNGQEFDNSRKRGEPFEFTVGAGMVIEGWEKGLVGMQVGGQRVLVIPADMAYGRNGIGPIPGNATLVFSIELLEIK